jgi:hypothetical protein
MCLYLHNNLRKEITYDHLSTLNLPIFFNYINIQPILVVIAMGLTV